MRTAVAPPTPAGPERRPVGVLVGALAARGDRTGSVLLWLAAALVAWSGVVHLHLWDTGYRQIPTIGPLFLGQAVAAVVVAVLLAACRRIWLALVALALVAGTIGGFVLSVEVGLFGFRDSWAAPFAVMAFAVEVAAAALLVAAVAWGLARAVRSAGPVGPAGRRAPGQPVAVPGHQPVDG